MQKNAISYYEYVEYACMGKKTCSWSAKKHNQQKMTEYAERMQHRLCAMPFLEVTILFNQHFIVGGNANPRRAF